MELDRRCTMPNTDVFNTIQFSSPLHRNAAGGGHTDLSEATSLPEQQAKHQEIAYEVPKLKPKPKPKAKAKPPSYDEALRARPTPPVPLAKNLALEAAQMVQLRSHQQQRQSSSGESTGEDLPMPTFPPHVCPSSWTQCSRQCGTSVATRTTRTFSCVDPMWIPRSCRSSIVWQSLRSARNRC